MNLAHTCLVLLACIYFARGQTHDPIKSVECDENGKLTATKSNDTYWNIPSSASCEVDNKTMNIVKTGNKLVFSGCPTGKNVEFTATHPNGGTTGNVVTSTANDDLSVTLRCDAIASDTPMIASLTGLVYKATHSVTPISKSATETFAMIMQLRQTGHNSSTTSMNLGDRYDLLIAGAGSHNTTVKRCTAADTTGTPEVEIYPGTGDTADTHVLTSFSKNADTSKTISGKQINQVGTLTGFRLVGSDTVVLKCTINVCAHSCELDARKRGKHPSNVRYATLKLKVRDNSVQTTANGSAGAFPVGGLLTKFLLVIASMKFLF